MVRDGEYFIGNPWENLILLLFLEYIISTILKGEAISLFSRRIDNV